MTVTDLHRIELLYQALGVAVVAHQPDVLALVGDFLDFCEPIVPQKTTADCARFIAGLDVPEIVLIRGNHEDADWINFLMAWTETGRKLTKLHGEAVAFGPAVMIGFPCLIGDDVAFTCDKEPLPSQHSLWVDKLVQQHGAAMRTLWLMHEPPAFAGAKSADAQISCNRTWAGLIKRFSPLLTISGHDHSTPIRTGKWFHRSGSTICVNVGQTESGPLHYTMIDAEFAGETPSLPTRMSVTAYPGGETVDIVGTEA